MESSSVPSYRQKTFLGQETPCAIPATLSGSLPHLSSDNLTNLSDLEVVAVNFADLYSCVDMMKTEGKSLKEFLNLPKNQILVAAKDFLYSPMSQNTRQEMSIETASGRRMLTAEYYMQSMVDWDADAIVSLADEVECSSGPKRHRKAAETTLQWLDTCCSLKKPDQKLYGVIVGGNHSQLRKFCAEETMKRNIDGIVLGGFGCGESPVERNEMVNTVVQVIKEEHIRIITGVDHPKDVLDLVELGVDAFVSTYPYLLTQNAYASIFWIHEDYIQSSDDDSFPLNGDSTKLNVRDKKFEKDLRALLPGCQCFTCTRHSRAYLNHLFNAHEMLGNILLYLHNCFHYFQFFRFIRLSIQKGEFAEFKTKFLQQYTA